MKYTIFIGSPDDVQEERKIIEQTIKETNRYYKHDNKIPELDLIKLDTDVRSMIVDQEAQTVIDKQIEGKYNVFIGILWKKFGSPTENYDSGTEQEFNNALEKHRQNPNSMNIMFYFCTKGVPDLKDVNAEQLLAVQNFKNKLQDKKGLYKEYTSIKDFEEKIKNDLIKLVTEKITFEENEHEIENDGLIDLMENYLDSFNESQNEMESLTEDIYIFAEELTNLTKIKPKTRKETKEYFSLASNTITNFSEDLESHNQIIKNSFHAGVSSFNSIMKYHGDIISENEIIETSNGMTSLCDAIDEINNILSNLIKEIENIRPRTNKFSKSKNNLIKNLRKFMKELNNMKEDTIKSKEKLLELKK